MRNHDSFVLKHGNMCIKRKQVVGLRYDRNTYATVNTVAGYRFLHRINSRTKAMFENLVAY